MMSATASTYTCTQGSVARGLRLIHWAATCRMTLGLRLIHWAATCVIYVSATRAVPHALRPGTWKALALLDIGGVGR